jgi:TPR repeat protein
MQPTWYRRLFSRRPTPEQRLREQAESGQAEAQFAMGVFLSNAAGESKANDDLAKAAEWYRKAADQNHAFAQFNLGVMYARGQGVAPDPVQAELWLRKAAEQGDAAAQHGLGTRCHQDSLQTNNAQAAQDRIEAYKWFRLASIQGYKGSSAACELITFGMSSPEVAEGIARVDRFTPTQQSKLATPKPS